MKKSIYLYTDASVQGNKSYYSIVEVISNNITKYYYHSGKKRNSYKVEFQAVRKAIELYKDIPNKKIFIRTDCHSLLNNDFLTGMLNHCENINLQFVKGHKSNGSLKHYYNRIADKLASKYNKGCFHTNLPIIEI